MKESQQKTWLKKYGVSNPMKVKAVLKKVLDNRRKASNSLILLDQGYDSVISRTSSYVKPLFTREEYHGCSYKNLYEWECVECQGRFVDHVDNGRIPICRVCQPITESHGERELADFIQSLGIEIQKRVLGTVLVE